MRALIAILLLGGLLACTTTAPDDSAASDAPATDGTVASDPSAEDGDGATEGEAATEGEEDAEQFNIVLNSDNPTISDTQDFAALTKKETIESDAARLKAQKEKFKVIAPTALPTSGKRVNVAAFALETTHNVGDKKYRRVNPLGAALTKQACARYRLPDLAQEAFLRAGGPTRDPGNLDPDGDGFACDWSPETYRRLVN